MSKFYKKLARAPSDIDDYNSKIKDFLQQVHGFQIKSAIGIGNPLDNLLSWGNSIYYDYEKQADQLRREISAHKGTQELLNASKKKVEILEEQLATTTTDFKTKLAKTSGKLRDLQAEHDKQASSHQAIVKSLERDHSSVIESLKTEHSRQADVIRSKHEQDRQDYEREQKRLLGELMVNQSENSSWTDDKLKSKYKELKAAINSLFGTHGQKLQLTSGFIANNSIDPTDFLRRRGNSAVFFFMRSKLWEIIYEQFFSCPFGFGAMGPGKGMTELQALYSSWFRLVRPVSRSTSPGEYDYSIFNRDPIANQFRTSTFRTIHAAVYDSASPAAQIMAQNTDQTTSQIITMLSRTIGSSDQSAASNMLNEVQRIVVLARDMALQFGIQLGHLRLMFPKKGEKVQFGSEYCDSEDGGSSKGVNTVDLVTLPGLQKIGNGQTDMGTKLTLVPCEIYPETILPTKEY